MVISALMVVIEVMMEVMKVVKILTIIIVIMFIITNIRIIKLRQNHNYTHNEMIMMTVMISTIVV